MIMKKILIAISFLCLCLTIWAQPGGLDTSFANNGKFVPPNNDYPNPSVQEADAVVVQPNGKILMAGYGIDYSDPSANVDFAVMRLNANGTPDNTFSGDGKAFIDFSRPDTSSIDFASKIVLQPDGKIIVVGFAYDFYYDATNDTYNYYDIAITRLNTDGSLDNTFNGNGKKLIDLANYTRVSGITNISADFAYSAAVKSNGKIIIAGYTGFATATNGSNDDAVIIQLNSNGSFDNNFNTDGINIIHQSERDAAIVDVAIQPDDKIVMSGYTVAKSDNLFDLLAIRVNANGTLDNNFNGDGIANFDGGSPEEYGYSVVLQSDNKIVMNGREYLEDGTRGFVLARLNEDGSLDNTFGGGDGVQTYSQPNELNYGSAGLALQTNGKIIVAGGFYSDNSLSGSDFEVLRFNADGSLDKRFGIGGRSLIDFGNWVNGVYDFAIPCALQPNGKIIVAGYTNNGTGSYSLAATRLIASGTAVTLSGPSDVTADVGASECSATINNIDPVIDPSNSTETVNYHLYGATQDSGTGSASGKQFNIGVTTVVYSLASNPLQHAIFTVTVTGGTPAGALDFDGKDDYVDLGNMYPIENGNYGQYSFEAWIKVRAYTNDDGLGSWIFGDERNFNGGIQVQLDTSGYITTFHPNTGFVKSSYKVPLHTWTHIAFVQSYSQLDLYVNGNFVQTLLTSPNLHSYDYDDFTLGAFTSDFINFTRHFNGQMDEVRVWDRAICQAQIQNNMNCELSGYIDGLTVHYKFNQGIASCSNLLDTILYDDAYGFQGVLKNFALSGTKSNWVKGHVTGTCTQFTPLSLTCPDPVTVNLEAGQCSAIVNFSASAVSGCGSNVTINYDPQPGTSFSAGTTYVSVVATDDLGNQQYCSFPVTVTENEPPVLITKDTSIALTGDGYVFLSPNDVIASVTDNCGLADIYTDASYFDCNSLGSHVVTVYATDNSGNTTTGTATVTITPFVTTSFVTVSPAPVQYSDVATFTAGIIGAAGFYYYGSCSPATEVTFKVGETVMGKADLTPDFYGNLVATLDKQMTKGFLDSLNVTSFNYNLGKVVAIFSGGSTDAVQFKKYPFTQLALSKEDTKLEYIGSQIINTQSTQVPVPVAVRITDIDDGYRGDITKANVTFFIEPLTEGVSIVGPDSITTSTISFVNKDHTSGIAQAKFKVSIVGKTTAKFRVTAKAGNYYRDQIMVPVIVSRSATNVLNSEGAISSISKQPGDNVFDVTVMPNPSHNSFKLRVQSSNKFEKLSLRIMDITGRVIELKSNVSVDETIQLGEQYKAGTYMVEVNQGNNIKVLKLVKL